MHALGTSIAALSSEKLQLEVREQLKTGVLKAQTYEGRASVVNTSCITQYEPLCDKDKKIVGMLSVAIPEATVNAVVQTLLKVKIGITRYPFVMDSAGTLLAHPKAELVGKNTLTDLKLEMFRSILTQRKPGEIGLCEYKFEGRDKFLSYTYFEPRDWIICVSGYWDEVTATTIGKTLELLQQEVRSFHHIATEVTSQGTKPRYNQIRFVDAQGQELYNVTQDQLATKLENKGNTDWFQAAKNLAAGEVYNSGVVTAANTDQAEMRVATPNRPMPSRRGLAKRRIPGSSPWRG
jgi:hypothetical protein